MTEEFIRGYSRNEIPWVCLESFHALIKREWLKFCKIRNYEKHINWHLNILKYFTRRIEYVLIKKNITDNPHYKLNISMQ